MFVAELAFTVSFLRKDFSWATVSIVIDIVYILEEKIKS